MGNSLKKAVSFISIIMLCSSLVIAIPSNSHDSNLNELQRNYAQWTEDSIINYSDCWYGNGINVGAYARVLLAEYYKEIGKNEKAKRLCNDILEHYPDAIDHNGNLLKTRGAGMLR